MVSSAYTSFSHCPKNTLKYVHFRTYREDKDNKMLLLKWGHLKCTLFKVEHIVNVFCYTVWCFLHMFLLTVYFFKVGVPFNSYSVVRNLGGFPLWTYKPHWISWGSKVSMNICDYFLKIILKNEITAIRSIQNFMGFGMSHKVFALLLLLKRI
jgi:hypothetical protein